MSDLIPSGETTIGVQGEKCRVLSNGENKAIPKPPFVRVSSIPWLAPTTKSNKTYFNHCLGDGMNCLKKIKHKKILNIKEKKIEWKKPR